jgi:gluconolactonase
MMTIKTTVFSLALATLFGLQASRPVHSQTGSSNPVLDAISPEFWNLFDHKAKLTKVAGDFGFTEGPVWDKAGYLWVSDETINKIYKVSTTTGQKQEIISLGDPDGNTYDRQHRLLDCASVLRAVIRLSPDGKTYTTVADH